METKGVFLKQKLQNMARWVEQEVGKENLPADLVAGIASRSELEASALSGALLSNREQVAQRDWRGLMHSIADGNVPASVLEVVKRVEERESMHEKFWRYMDLFVEVAQQ